jgi:hypothetical protein
VALAALARRYWETADAIRTARDKLTDMQKNDRWKGDAGRAFKRKTKDTAGKVGQTLVRYEKAAEGLQKYVDALREVQDDADDLLTKAKQAQAEADAARRAGMNIAMAPSPPDETPAQSDARAEAVRAQMGAADAAQGRVKALQDQLPGVVSRWDQAGNEAAGALEEIHNIDGLKDSRWEDFVGAMKGLAKWAGVAAAIFGVLALVCMIIPVLAPFAALFAALAFAASLVALGGNALAYSQGRQHLSNVLWDLAGVLTFGAGRAFTSVARVLGRGAATAAKPSVIRHLRAAGATKKEAARQARRINWTGTRGIPHGKAAARRAASRGGWIPRPGELARGYNPVRAFGEAFDDIRAVRAGVPAPSVALEAAADAVNQAVRGLPQLVQALPPVRTAINGGRAASVVADAAGVASTYGDLAQLGVPLPTFQHQPVPASDVER